MGAMVYSNNTIESSREEQLNLLTCSRIKRLVRYNAGIVYFRDNIVLVKEEYHENSPFVITGFMKDVQGLIRIFKD